MTDSRLVEIGVALPDRALAKRLCDALLARVIAERQGRDVSVLDPCAPPAKERS